MKTRIKWKLFYFFIVTYFCSHLASQMGPKYTILTKDLGNGWSTTNYGGIVSLFSKEANFGIIGNQRFNYEMTERSSISLGLGLQFTTSFPVKIQTQDDDFLLRRLGSFGIMIPIELTYNSGCQSIVNNNDDFGYFVGIGYAFAALPKYIDGYYYNSGSIGLYPHLGTVIKFGEKTRIGFKLFSILNHIEGGHPSIGLSIFHISSEEGVLSW